MPPGVYVHFTDGSSSSINAETHKGADISYVVDRHTGQLTVFANAVAVLHAPSSSIKCVEVVKS